MSLDTNSYGSAYTEPPLGSFEDDLESVPSQYLVNTKQQI